MLSVWSHLLWICFLNWWDEVPREKKWERGSICARALAVHTVLQSGRCLREVDTAAHTVRRAGRVRDGRYPIPSWVFPPASEILRCVECTGHKELSLEPCVVLLQVLREQLWGDTAGKHGGERGADPSTATCRPHVHRESSRKRRSLNLEHWSQVCCNWKKGVETRTESVCVLGSEQNGFNLSVHMLTGLCPHPECTEERPSLFTFLM